MRRRVFLGGVLGAAALPLVRRVAVAEGVPLPRLPIVRPSDLVLRAAPATTRIGAARVEAWLYNDALPGPALRMQRGEAVTITLRNDLPEPTITHWHGLLVPEAADGHPRFAIAPGATYDYRFTVDQPAGMAWYHPHTHMRTGYQVHRGLAGPILVEDDHPTSGLPTGERELILVLQDRTLADDGTMPYEVRGPAMMAGWFGDTLLVNGAPDPVLPVAPTRYRLRLLNGSASRIYELGLAPAHPFTVIGTDAGLLPSPVPANAITLAPAERIDLLVDFSAAAGTEVALETRPFELPAGTFGPRGMGQGPRMMRGRQGDPGRFLRFVVGRGGTADRTVVRLTGEALPTLPRAARERRFVFGSMMMEHTIDGRMFAMDRADLVAKAGSVERWTFVNDGPVPHPVHLHAARFLVRTRTGGRARTWPWEAGWKDTVLVAPSEVVTVDVHFGPHRGRFLLHCHNLVHEDMGMMLNVDLE